MTRWLRNNYAALALATALLGGGCTTVDDTLGEGFIPSGQQMSSKTVTLDVTGGFITTLAQQDSIPTFNTGYIFLGSKNTTVFGQTTFSGIVQPTPITYHTEDYFGYMPEIDSVYIKLYLDSYGGKIATSQTFDVFEVLQDIDRDSLYYASFDAQSVTSTDRLFSFTHSGATSVSARIDKTATEEGWNYINRLVAADGNTEINNDSLFVNQFKGLYITPREEVAGAAYKFNLDYYSNFTTMMVIYFHNHEEGYTGAQQQKDSGEYNKDTLAMVYTMVDGSDYYYGSSINKIKRAYPAALSSVLNTEVPVSEAYVEEMNGVYTNLTLSQDLIDAVLAEKTAGNNLVIHSAVLCLQLADGSVASLNGSHDRLGMYFDYANYNKPIPDYNYAYESLYSTTLPYGGFLNHSDGGYYSMNITTTLQRLLADPEEYQRTISVTPSAGTEFNFLNTYLKGTAGGYRIKLKLSYSLIPEK